MRRRHPDARLCLETKPMQHFTSLALNLAEQGLFPDVATRWGIRQLLKQRLREIRSGDARTAARQEMRFAGKRPQLDKTTVIYNSNITLTGIPLEAYDYVINGKSALDWVMERQCVKTDKASGIVNDANRYAIETVGDPAYPLKLFQRVLTVSLETMKILRELPKLEID